MLVFLQIINKDFSCSKGASYSRGYMSANCVSNDFLRAVCENSNTFASSEKTTVTY
jgi:hypothetical protein